MRMGACSRWEVAAGDTAGIAGDVMAAELGGVAEPDGDGRITGAEPCKVGMACDEALDDGGESMTLDRVVVAQQSLLSDELQ